MKKILSFLIVLSTLSILNVNADKCDASKLAKMQKAANGIKINHEAKSEIVTVKKYDRVKNEYLDETMEQVQRTLNISISGITEDIALIRATVTYTGEYDPSDPNSVIPGEEYSDEIVIDYSMTTNGVYTFKVVDINKFNDYRFRVVSNDESCDFERFRTIYYRAPKFNPYSENPICKENPTVSLCQEFISNDLNMDGKDFDTEVKKYIKSSGNTNTTTVLPGEEVTQRDDNSTNNYTIYIIIGGSVVVIGAVVYIIISRKRRAL